MAEVNYVVKEWALTSLLALESLFPSHPLAFSRLVKLENGKKTAPIIIHAASHADYATHLSPDAYEGVGALGMYPGLSIPDEKGRGWWCAPFFVGDFDAVQTPELEPLIDTLEGYGLTTYPTCGTTGRGSHLYGFVKGLVPQWQIYEVLKGIQMISQDAGLGVPEIRPSCKSGRGSPIFLPYRGAQRDSYGFNPLLDLARDMLPIKLEHAPEEVQRIPTTALEAFRLKIEMWAAPRAATQSHEVPVQRSTTVGAEDGITHLRGELERVAEHFVEPHRQNLVMALTAYGVRGLKLDVQTVKVEVTAFVKAQGGDELKRRLEALERTLIKYSNDPISVAWKEYYLKAGLTPPGKLGISRDVAAKLELAVQDLTAREWKGVSGSSDRSVFIALLQVAAEHGVNHKSGVAVSVSLRDLALKAGVGDKTVSNSLARLNKSKIVVRNDQIKRHTEHAGVLIILVRGVSELPHSFPLVGGLKEWGQLYTHPAFRHGKLNKSAAPLLVCLLREARPLTRPELAKLLGRKSSNLRKPLNKLLLHELVTFSEADATYTFSPSWEGALERAATITGAFRTEKRQRATHLAERAAFQAQQEQGRPAKEIREAA